MTLKPGITIIELLLVISIIAIVGTVTAPFLASFILRNNLETTTDQVVGSLRKAQNYALTGKNNATWGVCLSGSSLRFFSGSCASPTISENFSIPSSVTITGLSSTTFSTRGEPSSTLSITISTSIDSHTISLNSAGGLSSN